MALAPGTRLGPYEIVGAIGAGGMGEVYRAKDTRLSREVAIKVLPADLVNDPERRSRFEREAQAISALNHPNIVTLHEVGTSDAGPYLVLEKIEGQSLRDVIGAETLPLRRLIGVAAQIAEGLAKAHAAGIVHRDLKPDNVMITGDGFVKILDFGLARLTWPELHATDEDTTLARDTASGMVLGTLGYLSPEQASGKPADFRADQFALGSLLYEMATRDRPFRRGTMAESLAATIRDEPPALRSKREDLPLPFCWIVERCLAKDPDDRYASTRDLARDLADVRDRLSDLVKVQADSAAAGAARTARRRPLAWALGLTVGALGAGYVLGQSLAGGASPPTFKPLTFERGIVTGAKFSPDGQTIYYSAAYGAEPSRVFVTRLDQVGSELFNLKQPAHLLSVSTKGELAVLLTNDRPPANSVGTLARIPALGGSPREILAGVIDADWAPDGERLAIERRDGSIEFPIGRRLAVDGQFPRVSRDGERVAWMDGDGVTIADVEGRPVARDLLWAFGLAWRPDGREVWMTGSEDTSGAERGLLALSLSGQRRVLLRVPGALTVHDVSPDGRSALVATGAGRWGIFASRRGESQEQALDLLGRTQLVALSADGNWVLAYEPHTAGPGTYLRSIDGAQKIHLSRNAAIGLSPDGRWALTRGPNGTPLTLVPTSAAVGTPRDVPTPTGLLPRGGPSAQWSRDGRRLFIGFGPASREPTKARVYLREDEGAWRPVTPEGVASPFTISPDGRTIAAADTSGVITLFPVDGGPPRRLDGEEGVPVAWSTDGRWLFLRVARSLPARLYRRDLVTGRVEPWRDIAPTDLSGVAAVGNPVLLANDGAVVVYSYSRISSELYLVRGLR